VRTESSEQHGLHPGPTEGKARPDHRHESEEPGRRPNLARLDPQDPVNPMHGGSVSSVPGRQRSRRTIPS
jgi:hypothetical protein